MEDEVLVTASTSNENITRFKEEKYNLIQTKKENDDIERIRSLYGINA